MGKLTTPSLWAHATRLAADPIDLTIIGGGGDDSIDGSNDDDTIVSGGGNDTVNGRGGNDFILTQSGRDSVDGGTGDDTVLAGHNNDVVTGGDGFDLLAGQRGDDTLIGGNDGDEMQGSWVNDYLQGDAGNDFLIGDNNLWGRGGNEGDDVMVAGDGDDNLVGFFGDDVFDGGAGFDQAIFYDVFGGPDQGAVTVDLRIVGPQDTGQGIDTLISIEDLGGTDFADTLDGNEVGNIIFGAGGADTISGHEGDDIIVNAGATGYTGFGNEGDDSIVGANGADNLSGGDGNDFLEGIQGDDTLGGGLGDDVVYVAFNGNTTAQGGDGTDWLSFFDNNQVGSASDPGPKVKFKLSDTGPQTTQQGIITASGFENLAGGNWDDRLSGDAGDNMVAGDWGNDRLRGVDGDDTLIGDGFVNPDGSVDLSGGVFPFFVDYRDPGFEDTLLGARGNDTLIGGFATDILSGGPGVDTYVYLHYSDSNTAFGRDRIVGLQNADVVDLSAVDAIDDFDPLTPDATNDSFTLVDAFTGVAGQLTISYDSGTDTSLIKGDLDGDANGDLVIEVNGDVRNYDNFVL